MYILQVEDLSQEGPDGQTQDWPLAKFTNRRDADKKEEALTKFALEQNLPFNFFVYEEGNIEIDPSLQRLQQLLVDIIIHPNKSMEELYDEITS